jgi:hypothetical protein
MAVKSEYYLLNGSAWELHYFKTSADLIVETTSYKVMTADERTAISTYLATFNAANKLLQLDANAKVPTAQIPDLSGTYLKKASPTFTGDISGSSTSKAVVPGGYWAEAGAVNGVDFGQNAVEIWADSSKIMDISSLGGVNVQGYQIKNLGAPTATTDAATKEYVDNLVSAGFKVKAPVKAASTANITITAALNSLDGYTLAANDRVLIKNQTTASQNGVYQLNASKVPQKVAADSGIGSAVFVENGSSQNDYIYVCSDTNTWSMFSKPDTISAGAGLIKVGTQIRVKNNTNDGAYGITDDMIAGMDATKLYSYGADGYLDKDAWTALPIPDGNTLANHTQYLYAAIMLLRGTGAYNTNNTQTIAGAYSLAGSKAVIDKGSALPAVSGYNNGDVFLKTLA